MVASAADLPAGPDRLHGGSQPVWRENGEALYFLAPPEIAFSAGNLRKNHESRPMEIRNPPILRLHVWRTFLCDI